MKKNYRHIYREKKSLISSEAHIHQYLEQRDILGSTHGYVFLYALDGIAEEFHRERENSKWRILGNKLLKPSYFKKLLAEGAEVRISQQCFLHWLYQTDLRQLSKNELISAFLKGYQLYSRLRGYFKTSRPEFQVVAESKLRSLLTKKISNAAELQTVFEILTTPAELDDISREFLDWVKIIESKLTPKIIFSHIFKYPWLVAQSYNRAEMLETFSNKYHHDKKKIAALRKQVKLLKRTKLELKRKQILWYKRLKFPMVKYLSWLFQEAALERMRLKGGWAGADFSFYPLYREISRRTKIRLSQLYSFYRRAEVVSALQLSRPVVSPAELKRRKSAYVLWIKDKKLFFYSGAKAWRLIRQELKHIQKKTSIDGLVGQVASSGIAQGRARLVIAGNLSMLQRTFKYFKQGDIMITTMTQPNMIPLMKKAAAIVADEGGLISHAAIIAREFKIPCIVGTEIATKTFKDGDWVEVDANKGIIRKLK